MYLHFIIKRSYSVIPDVKDYKNWKLKVSLLILRILLKNRVKTNKCRGLKNKRRADLRNIFTLIAVLSVTH